MRLKLWFGHRSMFRHMHVYCYASIPMEGQDGGNEGSVMAYGQAAGESRVPEAVVIGLAHTLDQLALRPDSLRFVLAVLFLSAIRD